MVIYGFGFVFNLFYYKLGFYFIFLLCYENFVVGVNKFFYRVVVLFRFLFLLLICYGFFKVGGSNFSCGYLEVGRLGGGFVLYFFFEG